MGCRPGAEALRRPVGCAQASPLPTLLLLGDPRAHGSRRRSAGSRVPGLLAFRVRACARGAAPGRPVSERGALAAGRTRLVPGVRAPPPLRGVRAPQRSRRESREAGPGAGGAGPGPANLGLGRWEAAWGAGSPEAFGREGSLNPASVGWVTLVAPTSGCSGPAISVRRLPWAQSGLLSLPQRAAARSVLLLE